jgi:hypothetical protein
VSPAASSLFSVEELWRPPIPPTFSNFCCSSGEIANLGGRRLAACDPSDSDPDPDPVDSDPDSAPADSRPDSDPDDSQSDALEEFEPESELLAARRAFLLHFSQWPAYSPVEGGAGPFRIRLWHRTQCTLAMAPGIFGC